MNVRYQVFVSSTFTDLKAERSAVIQTLMEMDCIPAGMELFPAMDEEQWRFIQRVIDDCDYYVLILGGRYGSVSADGISYTEKEFDYALSCGMKVLAFIHAAPEELPQKHTDSDAALKAKLDAFRSRVSDGRLVKFWKKAEELPGLVALSLSKTIKTYPAVGWVRANTIASTQLLNEHNALHKELEQLKAKLDEYKKNEVAPEDLAEVEQKFEVIVHWKDNDRRYSTKGRASLFLSWRDIFTVISPDLQEFPNDALVRLKLANAIYKVKGKTGEIDEDSFKTIRVQLIALGLVKVQYLATTTKQMALFWQLTEKGAAMMFKWRAIRTNKGEALAEPPSPDISIDADAKP